MSSNARIFFAGVGTTFVILAVASRPRFICNVSFKRVSSASFRTRTLPHHKSSYR